MYENFKKRYKSSLLKDLFWRAASSANKHDFEMCMKRIELADPKIDENVKNATEWLREVPFQHWCRAYFRTSCKSDILVNNLCESFNNYILAARDKPIISMIEWIRTRLMSRIQMKKEGMLKYAGVEFEVDHLLDKYVVDLDKKTCTCGMYQLNGYPCCHAYAAIANKRNDVEDYVDFCYKKETYLKVYEYMIHDVPGQRDCIKTNYPPLRALTIKRKRSRPKKARRGLGDGLNSTRKGLTHTCKIVWRRAIIKDLVVDEVPEAPQQTKNAATQQSAGFDAPQPTQASQSAPIGTDGTRASGSNQRPRKQSTRGGKGTYQGTRNAAFLSACTNQGGSANMPTPRPRKQNARGGSANIPTESENTTRRRVHTAAGSSGGTSAAPAGSGGISAAAAGSGSGSGSGGTSASANTPGNKLAPKKKKLRGHLFEMY
ncbi:hypothetical protein BUALT_Bualt16G0024700 [Buddleja alternifolia]|uniref:SWIM-type domain-containing protein n=1 Tax=Buddleja alternifolia TaxID=168488 RepID=A0AAV6WGT6_9LAMI|nr:hypothetical protein BUALT_Bualt16G0024700 [Buddleja alternifolia]